jgi:2-phosphosulfolactate phosphatase
VKNFYNQEEFEVRCEWGEHGVAALAPISDVVIVVDVLSFSTSVAIAVHNGARVYPIRWRDERAAEYATSIQAELAVPGRTTEGYSLSPASLLSIPPGTRLVLPSLNGARLSLAARPLPVLAGCLRNARAVAHAAEKLGSRIAVIAAGEGWLDDYSLRPAFEDLVGAGAIISYLGGRPSPEALAAVAAFRAVSAGLAESLAQCSSGKELVGRGFAEDVHLAAQLNASDTAPFLLEDAFVRFVGNTAINSTPR